MSRTLLDASLDALAASVVFDAASSATPVSWPEAASIWSVMRPSATNVSSTSAEKRVISSDILLAARVRLGILKNLCVELFDVLHRLLEHADRARQRADLIATLAERDLQGGVACGHLLGDPGDGGERLGHGTADQDHAGGGAKRRDRREGEKSHTVQP